MKSAKVVNNILLSSLAFGVTVGIGMLIPQEKEGVKSALIATGALGSIASATGALVINNQKAPKKTVKQILYKSKSNNLKIGIIGYNNL